MREVYRILDANFNRAREALRVAEDCGRFALNDPAVTAMAKHISVSVLVVVRVNGHKPCNPLEENPGGRALGE